MSKKFFRPPPEAFDEDDESEEDSDEEEDEAVTAPPAAAAAASRPAASNNNANLSSDEDDSEDDDEDDEEEEEDTKKRKKSRKTSAPPKKKSKPAASSFFDMEAEASDDDDDDDEEYGGKDGEQMDAEMREMIRLQNKRREAAGQDNRTVEEIARSIENRHSLQRRVVDRSRLAPPPPRAGASASAVAGGGGGGRRSDMIDSSSNNNDMDMDSSIAAPQGAGGFSTHAVAQQSLMPSVSDPSLWMVSCMTGKEQELVFQIMNKCTAFARQGRPLGISAAIAAQSKGKIYIESVSEPAVMEAIQNVRGLLQNTMRLVPIGDMTTVSK